MKLPFKVGLNNLVEKKNHIVCTEHTCHSHQENKSFIKKLKLLQSGCGTRPHCDFSNTSITYAVLLKRWNGWRRMGSIWVTFKWADLIDTVLNCWHELSLCPRLSTADWLSCPLCCTAPFLSEGISPRVWVYSSCLLETHKLHFHCCNNCWAHNIRFYLAALLFWWGSGG